MADTAANSHSASVADAKSLPVFIATSEADRFPCARRYRRDHGHRDRSELHAQQGRHNEVLLSANSSTDKQTLPSVVSCGGTFTVTFVPALLEIGTGQVMATDTGGRTAKTTFGIS